MELPSINIYLPSKKKDTFWRTLSRIATGRLHARKSSDKRVRSCGPVRPFWHVILLEFLSTSSFNVGQLLVSVHPKFPRFILAGSTASSTVRPLAATTQHSTQLTQLFLVESPEGTWCFHEFPCVIFIWSNWIQLNPIQKWRIAAQLSSIAMACAGLIESRIDFRSVTQDWLCW